ncbi:MAG: type II toxin-antitoxin system HicA family toxin [Thermoplasmatota archaeon]
MSPRAGLSEPARSSIGRIVPSHLEGAGPGWRKLRRTAAGEHPTIHRDESSRRHPHDRGGWWRQVRQRGSHRHFQHAVKPGVVTISGSPAGTMNRGTLNSILKQSGLKRRR